MGSVYLAEHLALERRCAIKLLRDEFALSRAHIHRFTREAKATSRSAHPNVIEVLDAGYLPNGTSYFAMELLEGEDLSKTLLAEPRLPWPRVRHIALQICGALGASHARSVVHRDLKPANCFRITRGEDPDFIKVLDFGVAKLINNNQETLTEPGNILGTPHYMSPEQFIGKEIDHRTDIYALGAMIYRMLTGKNAFDGDSPFEIIAALMTRPPDPFSVVAPDLDLPLEVWPLVTRAMAHTPAERFESMQAFAAALASIQPKPDPLSAEPASQPSKPTVSSTLPSAPPETQTRARRSIVITSSIVIVAALLVIAVVFLRREPSAPPPPEVPRIILPTTADPDLPIACRQDVPTSCDAGMYCHGGTCVPVSNKTKQASASCDDDFFCEEEKQAPPYSHHCTEEGMDAVRKAVRHQIACLDDAGNPRSNCLITEASGDILTQDGLSALLREFPSLVFMFPSGHLPTTQDTQTAEQWPSLTAKQHYMNEIRRHAAIFRNAGLLLLISRADQNRTTSKATPAKTKRELVQELVLSSFAEALSRPGDRLKLSKRFTPIVRSKRSWQRLESYLAGDRGPTVWWEDGAQQVFPSVLPASNRERKRSEALINNSVIIVKIPQECVSWWLHSSF